MAITDRDLSERPEPDAGVTTRRMATLAAMAGINIILPPWCVQVRVLTMDSAAGSAGPLLRHGRHNENPTQAVGEMAHFPAAHVEAFVGAAGEWQNYSRFWFDVVVLPRPNQERVVNLWSAAEMTEGDWYIELHNREYVAALNGRFAPEVR